MPIMSCNPLPSSHHTREHDHQVGRLRDHRLDKKDLYLSVVSLEINFFIICPFLIWFSIYCFIVKFDPLILLPVNGLFAWLSVRENVKSFIPSDVSYKASHH